MGILILSELSKSGMHGLKIISVIAMVSGLLMAAALLLLWLSQPPYKAGSILLVVGLIFIVGAIILLCVAQDPDRASKPLQL